MGLSMMPTIIVRGRFCKRGRHLYAAAIPINLRRRSASQFANSDKAFDGHWSNASFEELGVHPAIRQGLQAHGIVRPTVVQADAFGPLVRGRDTVIRAETGSGKTLAYLLPLVNRIYHLHARAATAESGQSNPLQRSRPWVVLAPTADLCAQILAMLEAIDCDRLVAAQSLQRLFKWDAVAPKPGRDAGFSAPRAKERTVLQHGGDQLSGASVSASPQIKWGVTDIVVTTPMKFREDLEHFKDDGIFPACIVMDEADALFVGAHRADLFDIFAIMRPRLKIRQPGDPRESLPDLVPTQFVFAGATMPHIGPFSVGNMLIERFCTAHTVETSRFHRLPAGIGLDNVRWLPGSDDWDKRVEQLLDVLRELPCERTLVFVNSLHNCHVLLSFLRSAGWSVTSFMKGPGGRMGPRFRDAQKFVQGDANILIATDFGGRGIDWFEVDHVVNFQMATSTVNWMHRIGRTGRMGKRGLVTNLVAERDRALAELIQARLSNGKDLHGAFSRKRSLSRQLKQTQGSEETPMPAEDGTYRLHGGLELFQAGLAGDKAEVEAGEQSTDGNVIGYYTLPPPPQYRDSRSKDNANEDDVLTKGRRGSKRSMVPGADDEALDEFRRHLLASDSESDSDAEDGDGMPGRQQGKTAPQRESSFDWGMLEDGNDNGLALGPAPRRQLLDRSRRHEIDTSLPDDSSSGRRRGRRQGPAQGSGTYAGARKGLGVYPASKAAAGRNYAEPDDDLLL